MPYRPNANLNPTEAIYGFCAWLTTRAKTTKMSYKHDSSVIAGLIVQFIEVNNLPPVSSEWHHNIKMPKENDKAPKM